MKQVIKENHFFSLFFLSFILNYKNHIGGKIKLPQNLILSGVPESRNILAEGFVGGSQAVFKILHRTDNNQVYLLSLTQKT